MKLHQRNMNMKIEMSTRRIGILNCSWDTYSVRGKADDLKVLSKTSLANDPRIHEL